MCTYRPIRRLFVVAVVAACANPAPAPVANLPASVAVFAFNRTGNPVLVSGEPSVADLLISSDSETVEEFIAAQSRLHLARRGFRVITPEVLKTANAGQPCADRIHAMAITARASAGAGVLLLEIQRWDPEPTIHPRRITVTVVATFVDSTTGRELWSAKRRGPVATPAAVFPGDADILACRDIVENLLEPLGRSGSGSNRH